MSKTFRRLLMHSFVLALFLIPVSDGVACYYCDYSPHGWGFCKSGINTGWLDCRTFVEDRFNGTTDCEIYGNCYNGGDAYHYERSCNSTDTPIECLV